MDDKRVGPRVSVPAVERKDLLPILERYGLLASFQNATLNCTCCGAVLRVENFGVLLVQGDSLVPYCNVADCVEEAVSKQKN